MDFVRVDFQDKYIYLENTILCTSGYRAKELLEHSWAYQRIKRMGKLPLDKKANIWYNKAKR